MFCMLVGIYEKPGSVNVGRLAGQGDGGQDFLPLDHALVLKLH